MRRARRGGKGSFCARRHHLGSCLVKNKDIEENFRPRRVQRFSRVGLWGDVARGVDEQEEENKKRRQVAVTDDVTEGHAVGGSGLADTLSTGQPWCFSGGRADR